MGVFIFVLEVKKFFFNIMIRFAKLSSYIFSKNTVPSKCTTVVLNSARFSNDTDNGDHKNYVYTDGDILIPYPKLRTGEDLNVKKQRLLYQSRKRGIAENCLLLSNLPSNDWDIYYWVTGRQEVPKEFKNEVFEMLEVFTRNEGMESRLMQPELNS